MAGFSQIKHTGITRDLRQEILAGRVAPGARLSTQLELEDRFGVSGLTVQRALNTLVEEGFIYTAGRRGTFVVENPPHLSRYALIFPTHPADPWGVWNRFWTSLTNEAAVVERQGRRKVPVFYDVEPHEDNESYQRLVREVRCQRLAGLIFAFPPSPLVNTPLFADPELPRVAIMGPAPDQPKLLTVCPDPRSFLDRAIDYLAGRGRTRVALLTVPGLHQADYLAHFEGRLTAAGMTTRPYWCQIVSQGTNYAAANASHLLMMPIQCPDGSSERPDALIITDDNLLECASTGLLAAGVLVPEDLEVVAHCNFPWPPPSVLPVKRLGFDARRTLQLCIERVDGQRRGETPPPSTVLSAVFEDETESATPTQRSKGKEQHDWN